MVNPIYYFAPRLETPCTLGAASGVRARITTDLRLERFAHSPREILVTQEALIRATSFASMVSSISTASVLTVSDPKTKLQAMASPVHTSSHEGTHAADAEAVAVVSP